MSNYARQMARLSAQIFGEQVREVPIKSKKIVRLMEQEPYHKRPDIVEWYPRHPVISTLMRRVRSLGLYRDEHLDFKEEMMRLKKLRGKGPPKKGQGKRAQKRDM